jgi:CspA family cold shock protein
MHILRSKLSTMMNDRLTGTVKWFSRIKGFGFIAPDQGSMDVYVHYSAITGEGFRNLMEGQRVEFTLEESAKGLTALNVVGLEN